MTLRFIHLMRNEPSQKFINSTNDRTFFKVRGGELVRYKNLKKDQLGITVGDYDDIFLSKEITTLRFITLVKDGYVQHYNTHPMLRKEAQGIVSMLLDGIDLVEINAMFKL